MIHEFQKLSFGITDVSGDLQATIDNANPGDTVLLEPATGPYRLEAPITVGKPLTITGAEILFAVDAPDDLTVLFEVVADDVEFNNVSFTALPGAVTKGRHAIRFSNVRHPKVTGCRFHDLTQSDGLEPATKAAFHGVLAMECEGLVVSGCTFERLSGAPIRLDGCRHSWIRSNFLVNYGWPGIWLHTGNTGIQISGNVLLGGTQEKPVYWGGSIEVMGQVATAQSGPDRAINISGNYFGDGFHQYRAVVRCESSHDVMINHNVFDKPQADFFNPPGSGPSGASNNHIVLTVRDFPQGDQGPHRNIRVMGNTFIPAASYQTAIRVLTTSGQNVNTVPCESLAVCGNTFAERAGVAFQTVLALHGYDPGYRGITFSGNDVTVDPFAAPDYSMASVGGAVILACRPGAAVEEVSISGTNRFRSLGTGGQNVAVNLRRGVDRALVSGNTFKGFDEDVRVEDPASVVLINNNL